MKATLTSLDPMSSKYLRQFATIFSFGVSRSRECRFCASITNDEVPPVQRSYFRYGWTAVFMTPLR
jgi:hypothetical protein